jgi:hypothetical protein
LHAIRDYSLCRTVAINDRAHSTKAAFICSDRTFQFAEAALPRAIFAGILDLINGLRGPPAAAVPA